MGMRWRHPGNSNITVAIGQSATCTITNTAIPAQLKVNKVLNPTTDTGLFNLQIDGTTAGTGANAGHNGTTGFVYVTSNLPHTIGETAGTDTVLANYVATSSCVVNGGAPAAVTSVTLGPGIIATCTITNTRKGMVTLKKFTNGLDNQTAIWNFTLSGPGVSAPNNADSTPPTTVDFGGVNSRRARLTHL